MGQEGEGGTIFFSLPKVGVENGRILGQEEHLFLFIPLYTPSLSVSILPKTVLPQGAHSNNPRRPVPLPKT